MRVRATLLAATLLGLLVTVPVSALASTTDGVEVGGVVWLDLDGDGTRGDDEPARADVQVTLRTSATIVDATTTRSDGGWTFANVQPGTYTVVIEPPIDHEITGERCRGWTPTAARRASRSRTSHSTRPAASASGHPSAAGRTSLRRSPSTAPDRLPTATAGW